MISVLGSITDESRGGQRAEVLFGGFFVVEEPFFAPEFAGVAGWFAVFTDYSVAGDYDGYGVFAVGMTDCSYSFDLADICCLFTIRNGFAVRYVL